MKFDKKPAKELENIHSGITPHSETGDYSDVYVVTPAGNEAYSAQGL